MQGPVDQPLQTQEPVCAPVEQTQNGPMIVCEGPSGMYTVSWREPDGRIAIVLVQKSQINDILTLLLGHRA